MSVFLLDLFSNINFITKTAEMAELVDALVSGASSCKAVGVRVSFSAPQILYLFFLTHQLGNFVNLCFKIFILFVFFISVSCGKVIPEIQYLKSDTVEKELIDVSNSVKDRLRNLGVGEDLLSRTKYVTIKFEDDSYFNSKKNGDNDEAECSRYSSKSKTDDNVIYLKSLIKIRKSFWNNPPIAQKYKFHRDVQKYKNDFKLELIAHELGHCIWSLSHSPEKNEIMSVNHSSPLSAQAWDKFAMQIIAHQHLFKDLDWLLKQQKENNDRQE